MTVLHILCIVYYIYIYICACVCCLVCVVLSCLLIMAQWVQSYVQLQRCIARCVGQEQVRDAKGLADFRGAFGAIDVNSVRLLDPVTHLRCL